MSFIHSIAELGKGDAHKAGGKGASLGEMMQAGRRVPPGFVIIADAFERFIDMANLRTDIAEVEKIHWSRARAVKQISEKIRKRILDASLPEIISSEIEHHFRELNEPLVAIRSSATAEDSVSAAWAGQLDTYLNTNETNLHENIKRCWASLFKPQAILYRFEKGLHNQYVSMAVVVQKMIQSEISGVAFSVHPVTGNKNHMVIEAGWGLGEALVSGQTTPDSYVILRNSKEIFQKTIATKERALFHKKSGGNEWRSIPVKRQRKQALSDEQIIALLDCALSIEKHYGFPCDIEWAMEDGELYITQSRPITTFGRPASPSVTSKNYNLIFEGKGIPYLFEKALFDYYGPSKPSPAVPSQETDTLDDDSIDAVSIIKKSVSRDYLSHSAIASMREEGMERTVSDVQGAIETMESAITEGAAGMEHILKKPLTRQSVRRAFGFVGAIMAAYNFFDANFWDGVFETSEKNKKSHKIVRLVQEYKNIARDKFNSFFFENGYLPQLLEKIAEVTGVPCKDLDQYSEEDIMALLRGERVPKSELVARRNAYALTASAHNRIKSYVGKDALLFAKAFYQESKNTVTEIVSGKTAHATGKIVRGPVFNITRDYEDIPKMLREIKKMPKKAILVTQTTDPEMILALRKAAAVVTDVGGMLSHTAITARELNIPCIVGTGFASKVFTTGHIVEIDTDNGSVRRIR